MAQEEVDTRREMTKKLAVMIMGRAARTIKRKEPRCMETTAVGLGGGFVSGTADRKLEDCYVELGVKFQSGEVMDVISAMIVFIRSPMDSTPSQSCEAFDDMVDSVFQPCRVQQDDRLFVTGFSFTTPK